MKTCPTCRGKAPAMAEDQEVYDPCETCHGTGKLTRLTKIKEMDEGEVYIRFEHLDDAPTHYGPYPEPYDYASEEARLREEHGIGPEWGAKLIKTMSTPYQQPCEEGIGKGPWTIQATHAKIPREPEKTN